MLVIVNTSLHLLQDVLEHGALAPEDHVLEPVDDLFPIDWLLLLNLGVAFGAPSVSD